MIFVITGYNTPETYVFGRYDPSKCMKKKLGTKLNMLMLNTNIMSLNIVHCKLFIVFVICVPTLYPFVYADIDIFLAVPLVI